jgi:hypothetical protein
VAVEPYIPADDVPNVAQGMPLLGIAIVPVGLRGAGLTPAELISVEPRGMPVPPTDVPLLMSSGDVVPIESVGATVTPICATAGLQTRSAGMAIA